MADVMGQKRSDADVPLAKTENHNERDDDDELARIPAVMALLRPGDGDMVRGCVCDLVKALAGQWAMRGMVAYPLDRLS